MKIFIQFILITSVLLAQNAEPSLLKPGYLQGNDVALTVYNDGQISGPNGLQGEYPVGSGISYISDGTPLIGLELPDKRHSVIISRGPRKGQLNEKDNSTGLFRGLNPVSGYYNPISPTLPINVNPSSWPKFWYDHPEWGNNVWYGFSGPGTQISFEAYIVTNDQHDNEFLPNGQGIEYRVRYLQCPFPYEDIIFRIIDIKNNSNNDYNKAILGYLTGTTIGGEEEGADDISIIDPSKKIIYSYDMDGWAPRIKHPAYMAEAIIDETNIFTSFKYFHINQSPDLSNDEALWSLLNKGIANDQFTAMNGDYIYGMDISPLKAKESKQIVLGYVFGANKEDLYFNVDFARKLWKEINEADNLKPIIFIPGIMGSGLYNDTEPKDNLLTDNELIWINHSKLASLSDEFLDVLQLDETGENPLKAEYNIKVAPIRGDQSHALRDELEIPPLNYYKEFFEHFEQNGYSLDYTGLNRPASSTNLFCFTYDWRRSLSWNGKKLSDFIDSVISWTNTTKVNIIAHSMGGLLTKSCIKNFGNDRIGNIIFIGTPHLGAPKIYYTMLTGDTEVGWTSLLNKDWFVKNQAIRKITLNMPSAYQLFPTEEYYDPQINNGAPGADSYTKVITKLSFTQYPVIPPILSGLEYYAYSEALNFFKSLEFNTHLIDSFHAEQDQLSFVDFGTIELYNIVGFNNPSIGEVYVNYFNGVRSSHQPVYNLDGDGTVPVKSAEIINGQILNNTFYIEDVDHSNLPSDETVLKIITSLIKSEVLNSSYTLPTDFTYTKNDLWQTIIACPVLVNVYDAEGRHTGPTSDSTYVEDIPGSKYIPANLNDPSSTKIILLPKGGSYRFEIKSQDTSSFFDFNLFEISKGNVESVFTFDSVKTEASTKAYCQVDSITSNISLDIDIDGNNTIDTVYHPIEKILTHVKQPENGLPSSFELFQNFPNPFNPSTNISYSLPRDSYVLLRIYDILGNEVKVLVNEHKTAGYHSCSFDAHNLSTGVYLYKIDAGEFSSTKKLVLIK